MSNVYPIGPLNNDARRVRQLERDMLDLATQLAVYREALGKMCDVADGLKDTLAGFSHAFFVNDVDKRIDAAGDAIFSSRLMVGE